MMPARSQTTSMPLSELLSLITSGEMPLADPNISGLCVDSRAIQAGDLFLACAGYQVHASVFIPMAVSAGAVAVLVEVLDSMEQEVPLQDLGVPCIPVFELRRKVSVLADYFYGRPSASMWTVGVTGTDGKTSCSHFIAQAIQQAKQACGLIGTLGYGLYGDLHKGANTTPDALYLQQELLAMKEQQATVVILEVSSHALEQGRVNGVHFDVAVLTNLGRDHLDFHGDMAHYAAAKKRLFQMTGLSHVVLNIDDEFGRALLRDDAIQAAVTAYGLEPQSLESIAETDMQWVWADAITMDAEGMCIQVRSSWGEGALHTHLLGRFNVSNLLAALAVLLLEGVAFDLALQRLSKVVTVAGRMERFGGGEQPLVVVDYAHTPNALEQVLKALLDHCRGSLWCVFGAGGDRDAGKRPLMGKVAETYANRVVVTDDNPRGEDATQIVVDILAQMDNPDAVYIDRDRAQAIKHAISCAQSGDVVLIAGKGHETEQLVAGQYIPFSDKEQVLLCLQGSTQ